MKKIAKNNKNYDVAEWYSNLLFKLGFRRISKAIVARNYYVNLNNGDICRVTADGRLKSLAAETTRRGYQRVNLKMADGSYQKILIHRLIGLFIPNHSHKKQINHKNLTKTDNSISNLEWVTPQENSEHYQKNKRRRLK